MRGSEAVLAIIPFQSSNVELSTLLQNFEEDLVYHFSKFQGLSVLSYFSTSQLTVNDDDVLKRYRVSHIVTGSFRRQGERVAICIQLIEFPTRSIIYDQRIAYQDQELFELQDQAVMQITNLLQKQLDRSILSNSYNKPKVKLDAYELLLLGNAHLQLSTPDDDLKARAYFEEALNIQPNYSRAYSGISSSYFNQWSCQLWDRWEISQHGAKKYALKAIELDENDYLSLCILGRTLLFERDYERSEFYLRKSFEMNQNDADTLLEIAFSMMFLGYVDEAIGLYERACRLNPLKEDKYLSVGATLVFEKGDFKQALEMGKKLEIQQTYIDFPLYMAAASHYLGFEEEAGRYWEIYLHKFQNHIYFHDKQQTQDAISWHIHVNPYKESSRLQQYLNYLKKGGAATMINRPSKEQQSTDATITIAGGRAELHYSGKVSTINSSKGLLDIIKLLKQPHQDFHCMELMGAKDTSSGVEVLDEKSRSAYQQRIKELQIEICEAEDANDVVQTQKLNEEYERLIEHLSSSLGLNRRSRKISSAADKARSAVTLRIKDCIRKIAAKDELLGSHLTNSVKTGLLCSYRPEGEVKWNVEEL